MLASSSRSALKAGHGLCQVAASRCQTHLPCAHASRILAHGLATEASPSKKWTPKGSQPRTSDRTFRPTAQISTSDYNNQLARKAEERATSVVMTIARRMKEQGVPPNRDTYNSILHACALEGLSLEARAVFEDMLAMGVHPDRTTFHHLLQATRYVEQIDLFEILRMMEDWSIRPNEVTYEIIITKLAKAHRLELALQFLSKLPPAGLSPTLQTAEEVIKAATELGFARLALDLAEAFEQTSVRRLTITTWADVLGACAQALYADGVTRAWRKVVHVLNVTPDEGLCLQVLHTAGRHGLSALALEVFEVLKRLPIVFKEQHIAPVIEAMCHHGQIKEAIILLDFMRGNDIAPTLETATPIFERISVDVDAIDSAWGILETLKEEGQPVDVVALNVVIQAALALEDLQRAVGTYKARADIGVTADVETYNVLLRGCHAARHRELADRLLKEMKQAGVKPDAATYDGMIQVCLTQPLYEDAFFYLEEMKAAGMLPPLSVYEAIIRKLVYVGDVRYKLALEELKECGYEVSERLKSYIDSGGAHNGPERSQGAGRAKVTV